MRARVVIVAALAVALLAIFLAPSLVRTVQAQDVPSSKLFLELRATSVDGEFRFVRERGVVDATPIVVGEIPRVVNVTLINDDPIAGTFHTFTIRSSESDEPLVDVALPHGSVVSVEFILWEDTKIEAGARNETTEAQRGQLRFFCRPHEAVGMLGFVAVGGVEPPAEPPEKGVFLRAYWIGVLGIAGTMLLVVISYFVIKSSSRHFTDHHEHIRRGGP